MEFNSENTSDANGVHLEGNFLSSQSFFVLCRFLYALRHNDANKMTLPPRPTPTACVISRFSIKYIVF